MPAAPIIRHASIEDVDALREIAIETFRATFEEDNEPADMELYLQEKFGPARIRADLEDPTIVFLLAFNDPNAPPIGYAKLVEGKTLPSVSGPAPVELERLYLRREAIGQGLGAALMRACLDEAARTGHRTIWLGVWEENERAFGFYRRWGFEKVGEHVFMLGRDPQTDWIMARPVSA